MHSEKQFTPYIERHSLPSAIPHILQYYRSKYPERPKIHYVTFDAEDSTDLYQNLQSLSFQSSGMPIKIAITHIKETDRPFKTNYIRNNVHISLEYKKGDFIHMEPGILIDNKLIILRNSWLMSNSVHPEWQETSKYLTENGYKIILPKHILNTNAKTSAFNNYLSYQGSSVYGCPVIGISILKDITYEDLNKYSTFEKGYALPPKVLKYCPTRTFIIGNIGESAFQNSIVKIKEDPSQNETLELYFTKHTKVHTRLSISSEGEEVEKRKVRTRIEEKTSKYLDILSKVPEAYTGRRTMSRSSFSVS